MQDYLETLITEINYDSLRQWHERFSNPIIKYRMQGIETIYNNVFGNSNLKLIIKDYYNSDIVVELRNYFTLKRVIKSFNSHNHFELSVL